MKLTELEPQFVRREIKDGREWYVAVDTLAEAQGMHFLCPKCFAANGGNVGTHSVLCWFANRGVPEDAEPLPGRWPATGTSYADLTLTPSILLGGEASCGWHGFITAGDVTSC